MINIIVTKSSKLTI